MSARNRSAFAATRSAGELVTSETDTTSGPASVPAETVLNRVDACIDPHGLPRLPKDAEQAKPIDWHRPLCYNGIYRIWITRGAVHILGAILRTSSDVYNVFAPFTNAAPQIRGLGEVVGIRKQPSEPWTDYPPYVGIQGAWDHPDDASHSRPPLIYHADAAGARATVKLDIGAWHTKLNELATSIYPPRREANLSRRHVLVTGDYATARSTFVKVLANRLLTELKPGTDQPLFDEGVFVLDLDHKQPEFGLPGYVSLIHIKKPVLGPAFTAPLTSKSPGNKVISMRYISESQALYHHDWCLSVIRSVMITASEICTGHPLLINSPGWLGTTAGDENLSIPLELKLTDAVHVSTTTELRESEVVNIKGLGPVTHHMVTAKDIKQVASSNELRVLHLQSYFHVDDYHHNGTAIWSSLPVSLRQPNLCFSYPGKLWAIFNATHVDIPEHELAEAITGSVIAIVALAAESIGNTMVRRTADERLPFISKHHHIPFDAGDLKGIGLGYVHRIVADRREVEVSSPESMDEITKGAGDGGRLILVLGDAPSKWVKSELEYI